MKELRSWNGVITGSVTPFTTEGEIDWASLEKHVDRLAQFDIRGLLVNAMMAEGGHLTAKERDDALRFVIARAGNKVPVIATIYGANTGEAAEEAGRAAQHGASGLLVVPHPVFGGTPLDPELPAAYFDALWRAAKLPMIVFRTPAALAPNFGLEVLKRLTDVPGVAAIKDSAADPEFYRGEGAMFLAPDSPLKVLIDSDPLMFDFLRLGAHGATSICAAVDTGRYVQLLNERMSEGAEALAKKLRIFADAVYRAPFRDFRARLKHALAIDGAIATAKVRPPLFDLSAPEQAVIAEALRSSRN